MKQKLIPKKGDWILIRRPIPIALPVPPFSIWYAVPTKKMFWTGEEHIGWQYSATRGELEERLRSVFATDMDGAKLAYYRYLRGNKDLSERQLDVLKWVEREGYELHHQVKIVTPWGQCNIQPHEYVYIDDINTYIGSIQEGEATLEYLSDAEGFKGRISDQIFYLRSRGIDFTTALLMVSGNIKSQYLFWIKIREDIARCFVRDWDWELYERTVRLWEKKINELQEV